jgi:hypothetical protein
MPAFRALAKNKAEKGGIFLACKKHALKHHVRTVNHHKSTTIYHPKNTVENANPL